MTGRPSDDITVQQTGGGRVQFLLRTTRVLRSKHPLSRRKFLHGAGMAAMSMAIPGSWGLKAAAAAGARPNAIKQRGPAQPFDYARLKGIARKLAESPYTAPPSQLPPPIAKLDWDHWQSIRFREEHSVRADEGLRFRIQFAHLGFVVNKPVR